MAWKAAGYEVVVGVEVHAQLATRHKLFSGAPATTLHAHAHAWPPL